jgi:uncharacterized membrane protein YqjE
MEPEPKSSAGLLAALRRLGRTALGTLRNRVELFALELREEHEWFVEALILAGVCLMLGAAALVGLTVTIVVFAPPPARPYVLGAFSLVYLGLAIGAGFRLRAHLKDRTPPFSDTVSELKKDIAWADPQE